MNSDAFISLGSLHLSAERLNGVGVHTFKSQGDTFHAIDLGSDARFMFTASKVSLAQIRALIDRLMEVEKMMAEELDERVKSAVVESIEVMA